MTYFGRVPLGGRRFLNVLARDYNNSFLQGGSPQAPLTAPTTAPRCRIWLPGSGAGVSTVIDNFLLPVKGPTNTSFAQLFMVDQDYVIGNDYLVTITYGTQVTAGRFQVVQGDARGSAIAVLNYQGPSATHLVYETDSGELFAGRNPK